MAIDVLVVEDDPATKNALPILLESAGFTAISVNTVADGIKALLLEPKNLLLDLGLPDGSGMEILTHIEINRLPIRVAIVSGQAEELPADIRHKVLAKPVNIDDLIEFLNDK
jgi:DNA-binding response OmpR family regulator